MELDLRKTTEIYKAGEELLNIRDLLKSFIDPDLCVNGISRISDFHFKIGQPIRYRFDGDLETIPGGEPLSEEAFNELVFPLLRDDQIERFKESEFLDVDAGYEWHEKEQNFRLNLFRDRQGPACVIRMLPRVIPSIESIGFSDDDVWREIVQLKQGLVLVTGITGSGKTTTIASLIDKINRERKVRIITLEDPIEYFLESDQALISQRQVGTHVETFHGGLRSALREDPDIIFVGEMRDQETASLAMTAAETGHLVFSTLHTKDSKGAISRIVDLFPGERGKEAATQLSFNLSYVLGQKLMMRADGRGRCMAMEIMKNIGSIGNLIRLGKWHQLYSVMETQSKHGMITMEQCLVDMVEHGDVTKEEAMRHANDATHFK